MIQSIFKKNTIYFILLLIILLVSIANRFYGLNRLSLWADELWVVMASTQGSLTDMFSYVYFNENHPPGHYLLMRYWQIIFGNSGSAIRFPFFMAGVFLVYSTYRVAKQHYSVEAGLIAATLVSGSWQAIYYSQEARANIIIAVAAVWTLHYFYQMAFIDNNIDEKIDKKKLTGFWISATVACYFHYSGLIFVACLGIIYFGLLFVRRKIATVMFGLILFFPIMILYAPWLPGTIYQMKHGPADVWRTAPEWMDLYVTFKVLFEFGSQLLWLYQFMFLMLLIFFILFIINSKKIYQALASAFKTSEPAIVGSMQFSAIIFLMIFMPVLAFFIKSRISQPAYDSRHFIYIIPLMAMVAGYVISLFFSRWSTLARNVILVLVILLLILTQNYFNILTRLYTGRHMKPEYRSTVKIVVQDTKKSVATNLIIGNSLFFNHYLQRYLQGRELDFLLTDAQQMPTLNEIVKTRKVTVLYFLETPDTGSREMISILDVTLADVYHPVCRTGFHFSQIIKFSTDPTSQEPVNFDLLPICN